jgi:hypothetical protein
MEYTQEQLAGFKAEFARRQKRQFAVAAVLLLGVFFLMMMGDKSPLESPVGMTLLIGGMAAILFFTFQNWRCPACQKYLGKGGFPRFCPRCGVALK